ncbi:MAG TPA: putative zinc-binding protein [Gammaproteobacteria bacterium]
MKKSDDLPLVYSCSGCSSAAQLANTLAVRLDRAKVAEMSCIAGVGGGVKSLVNKAKRAAASNRKIVVLDGCHLQCARHCLDNQGVTPDVHLRLNELGIRKEYHADVDAAETERVYKTVLSLLPEN